MGTGRSITSWSPFRVRRAHETGSLSWHAASFRELSRQTFGKCRSKVMTGLNDSGLDCRSTPVGKVSVGPRSFEIQGHSVWRKNQQSSRQRTLALTPPKEGSPSSPTTVGPTGREDDTVLRRLPTVYPRSPPTVTTLFSRSSKPSSSFSRDPSVE